MFSPVAVSISLTSYSCKFWVGLNKHGESRKLSRIRTRPKANRSGQRTETRVYPQYYVTLFAKKSTKKINNNKRQMQRQSGWGKHVNLWLGLGQQKQKQKQWQTFLLRQRVWPTHTHAHQCTNGKWGYCQSRLQCSSKHFNLIFSPWERDVSGAICVFASGDAPDNVMRYFLVPRITQKRRKRMQKQSLTSHNANNASAISFKEPQSSDIIIKCCVLLNRTPYENFSS